MRLKPHEHHFCWDKSYWICFCGFKKKQLEPDDVFDDAQNYWRTF